jgi:hypothetical protein
MALADQKQDGPHSEAETKARADATLKRMLATPHEKHKPLAARKHGPVEKPE